MPSQVKSYAPAKIILSGEHSVVHEKPGLSLAIDLNTVCDITYTQTDYGVINVELVDYNQKYGLPTKIWQRMVVNINKRFHLFQTDKASISTVLTQPIDLIILCIQHFNDHIKSLKGTFDLKIHSHNFIGRGLGTSASVIISILNGFSCLLKMDPDKLLLIDIARKIETYQHGQSSGIDPASVLLGGLIKFTRQNSIFERLHVQPFEAWIIDTGIPTSSTGQCVTKVKEQFPTGDPIWNEFETVTLEIEKAWESQDFHHLKNQIRKNQALLETIGVVPTMIQQAISLLSLDPNVAAKICGAGSITADNAGVILCISYDPPKEFCQQYGFKYFDVAMQSRGAYCETND